MTFIHDKFSACASEILHTANLKGRYKHGYNTLILSNSIIHLSYACHVRKVGTLLYWTNGDLLTPLTLSLHSVLKSSDNGKIGDESQDFTNAFARVNSCIHNEIHKHLSADLNVSMEEVLKVKMVQKAVTKKANSLLQSWKYSRHFCTISHALNNYI